MDPPPALIYEYIFGNEELRERWAKIDARRTRLVKNDINCKPVTQRSPPNLLPGDRIIPLGISASSQLRDPSRCTIELLEDAYLDAACEGAHAADLLPWYDSQDDDKYVTFALSTPFLTVL